MVLAAAIVVVFEDCGLGCLSEPRCLVCESRESGKSELVVVSNRDIR